MCLILNVIMLIAFAVELWFDYEIVLDNQVAMKLRRKYIVRLVIASITLGVALMILYKAFGVDSYNLGYYIRFGKVK